MEKRRLTSNGMLTPGSEEGRVIKMSYKGREQVSSTADEKNSGVLHHTGPQPRTFSL